MRPNSLKIFVFVTDDDARVVTSENFFKYLAPELRSAVIFSFAGVKGSSIPIEALNNRRMGAIKGVNGCQALLGQSYQNLAEASGGSVFDICEEDWTKHFNKLTNNVSSIVNNRFILKNNKKLISVEIDGKKLENQEYRIEANTLIINEQLIDTTSKFLTVKYDS